MAVGGAAILAFSGAMSRSISPKTGRSGRWDAAGFGSAELPLRETPFSCIYPIPDPLGMPEQFYAPSFPDLRYAPGGR